MIKELSKEGAKGYVKSIEHWLMENQGLVDCKEKRKALKFLFKDSKVAVIQGAAGTGKTTMIKHISSYYKESKKIYLANTNTALNNLEKKRDESFIGKKKK